MSGRSLTKKFARAASARKLVAAGPFNESGSVSNSLVSSFLPEFIGGHESDPKPTARHQELSKGLVRFPLVPIFHRLDDAVEDTIPLTLPSKACMISSYHVTSAAPPAGKKSSPWTFKYKRRDWCMKAHDIALLLKPTASRAARYVPSPLCSVARAAHALYKLSHHASSLAGLGWRLHEHFALDAA